MTISKLKIFAYQSQPYIRPLGKLTVSHIVHRQDQVILKNCQLPTKTHYLIHPRIRLQYNLHFSTACHSSILPTLLFACTDCVSLYTLLMYFAQTPPAETECPLAPVQLKRIFLRLRFLNLLHLQTKERARAFCYL